MKKIFALLCALAAAAVVASCSAEDDTSFNTPMIDEEGDDLNPGGNGGNGGNGGGNQGGNGDPIDNVCGSYSFEGTQGTASLYYCDDDDECYGCTSSVCVVIDCD